MSGIINMKQMKIVIPDKIDLDPEHLEQLKSFDDSTIYEDRPTQKEVASRIKDAEIVTANWIDITAEIIEQSHALQYIIVPAVGYDWVDVEAATKKGIKVINCPTQNSPAVANFTIGLLVAITRRIVEAQRALEQGIWEPTKYTGIELKGKTLGLIGYGRIGKRVEMLAEGFGMKVKHVNSQSTADEMDALIASSDIVSLHASLTPQTKRLLDERRLHLMKKGSYLINTARGDEIDQTALLGMLESGHLAGAALDVFERETFSSTPSEEIVKLAKMPNVIATPHMGFNTKETQTRLGEELIANINFCLNNNPTNIVNEALD